MISYSFLPPPFCQWIRPNSNNHTWCKQKNKHWIVPKLMISVPKWNKRNNWRKIDKSFYELLDTINRMNTSKAENSPSGKSTKPRSAVSEKSVPKRCQKKVSWSTRQLLLCLKPSVVFFNLVEDWSWEIVSLRSIVEQSGTVRSISFSFESIVRLTLSVWLFVELWFRCRSNSGRNERFTDYQRKVVVLNCLQIIRCF